MDRYVDLSLGLSDSLAVARAERMMSRLAETEHLHTIVTATFAIVNNKEVSGSALGRVPFWGPQSLTMSAFRTE